MFLTAVLFLLAFHQGLNGHLPLSIIIIIIIIVV